MTIFHYIVLELGGKNELGFPMESRLNIYSEQKEQIWNFASKQGETNQWLKNSERKKE